MVIEISISLIAFALIVSMICLIVFLLQIKKTLESAKRDLHNISSEATGLMNKVDNLVSDIQSKADSLDLVFRPLKAIRKTKLGGNTSETVSEIIEWVSTSLALFKRIRNAVKHK